MRFYETDKNDKSQRLSKPKKKNKTFQMLNSIRCFIFGICSQSQEQKRRLMTGSPELMKTIPTNKTILQFLESQRGEAGDLGDDMT